MPVLTLEEQPLWLELPAYEPSKVWIWITTKERIALTTRDQTPSRVAYCFDTEEQARDISAYLTVSAVHKIKEVDEIQFLDLLSVLKSWRGKCNGVWFPVTDTIIPL